MAGTLSTALIDEILDHVFLTGSYSQPAGIWMALYSSAPTAAGGGSELTGNAYARKQMDVWDVSSTGATENTNAITFAAASGGDWSEAVAYGIFDAVTSGNFLAWGDLTVSKTVKDGDTAEFAAGELDISIT